jgi:hypothetical protein
MATMYVVDMADATSYVGFLSRSSLTRPSTPEVDLISITGSREEQRKQSSDAVKVCKVMRGVRK